MVFGDLMEEMISNETPMIQTINDRLQSWYRLGSSYKISKYLFKTDKTIIDGITFSLGW
ncbi:MAG: hypothetical protein CM15mP59_5570 [Flavobacteriaceae bacterium]|nr:MAG: hypothetical protein CM15mP59_5570 [Flavobacteriaceae bacterium]